MAMFLLTSVDLLLKVQNIIRKFVCYLINLEFYYGSSNYSINDIINTKTNGDHGVQSRGQIKFNQTWLNKCFPSSYLFISCLIRSVLVETLTCKFRPR